MTIHEIRTLPPARKLKYLAAAVGGQVEGDGRSGFFPISYRDTLLSLGCKLVTMDGERPGFLFCAVPSYLESLDAIQTVIDALPDRERYLDTLGLLIDRPGHPCGLRYSKADVLAYCGASVLERADACLVALLYPEGPLPVAVSRSPAEIAFVGAAALPVIETGLPPTPAPFKKKDWVMAAGNDTKPDFGVVKDIYHDAKFGYGTGWSMDLVLYSPSGEKVGRRSEPLNGPRTFEPAVPCDHYERIEEPKFPIEVGWGGGFRSELTPVDARQGVE